MPAVLSPDGNYVLYGTRLTDPDHQIMIRSVDGGDEILVVPDGLEAANPISLTATISWANDGTVLLHGPSPSLGTLLTIDGVTDFDAITPRSDSSATPVPVPVPVPVGDDHALGSTVTVNDNDVPLRSAPGTDA